MLAEPRSRPIGWPAFRDRYYCEGLEPTEEQIYELWRAAHSDGATDRMLRATGASSRSDRRFDRAVTLLKNHGWIKFVGGRWKATWPEEAKAAVVAACDEMLEVQP